MRQSTRDDNRPVLKQYIKHPHGEFDCPGPIIRERIESELWRENVARGLGPTTPPNILKPGVIVMKSCREPFTN